MGPDLLEVQPRPSDPVPVSPADCRRFSSTEKSAMLSSSMHRLEDRERSALRICHHSHAAYIFNLHGRHDQRRASKECFPLHRNAASILRDRKAEAATVRELREWIEREIHVDLTNAPFDPQDGTLLPKAGRCARYPKRTGSNPLLFPEVRQKSI